MRQTEWLQETRMRRFEEAYWKWRARKLTQDEAAELLGVCERTFRRYTERYEEDGPEGLYDKRMRQTSHKKAPGFEVQDVIEKYRERHQGWNVKHYYSHYRRGGGKRSYTWVKTALQAAGEVARAKGKGKHRKKRDKSPLIGMMIHQDGSTHEWVKGQKHDLIATMDDATNEIYSLFLVEEEGTQSSMRGVRETVEAKGIFCTFYSDRASHYWHTPEAGGKVDKKNPTQFGAAMERLGVEMIPAYSPEARGRSERAFATHQERLPKELALAEIADIESANRYIKEIYLARFNEEFKKPAREEGSAFVPLYDADLDEIFCEKYERKVGNDNCVVFEGKRLQIPADRHRFNYVRAKVKVHRYGDSTLAIFHGPRCLARYDVCGKPLEEAKKKAA